MLEREIECTSLTWECCSPSFPSGKPCPLSWKYCLPPSFGFPPKSFPLKRETHHFGGHLRHSGTRASEDGAFTAPPCYAACNAPASRKEWRIASARFVSPRHSYGITSCQATSRSEFSLFRLRKRNGVFKHAPNEITSCQATSRSEFSLNRLRKSARRVRGRPLNLFVVRRCHSDEMREKAPFAKGSVLNRT